MCVSSVVYTEILSFFVQLSQFLPVGSFCSPCWTTPTCLRLVRSRTQTHSANCRLVLHTPHQNHRQDGCGFNGQRKQRGPQKQTQTLKQDDKYTDSPLRSRINTNTNFALKSCLVSLNKCLIQTLANEMVENPKWRPWLRFQRDMTIQCCNYMCCNALLIILVQRHTKSLKKNIKKYNNCKMTGFE